MILDSLEHLGNYTKFHAGFAEVLKFLADHDLQTLPLGRCDIKGEDVFVSINAYATKETPKVEFHKAYADIQIVLEGHNPRRNHPHGHRP